MLADAYLYNAIPMAAHPWIHLTFATLGLIVFYLLTRHGVKPSILRVFFVLYSIGEFGNALFHLGFFAWGFAHLLQESLLFAGLLSLLYTLLTASKPRRSAK